MRRCRNWGKRWHKRPAILKHYCKICQCDFWWEWLYYVKDYNYGITTKYIVCKPCFIETFGGKMELDEQKDN